MELEGSLELNFLVKGPHNGWQSQDSNPGTLTQSPEFSRAIQQETVTPYPGLFFPTKVGRVEQPAMKIVNIGVCNFEAN